VVPSLFLLRAGELKVKGKKKRKVDTSSPLASFLEKGRRLGGASTYTSLPCGVGEKRKKGGGMHDMTIPLQQQKPHSGGRKGEK